MVAKLITTPLKIMNAKNKTNFSLIGKLCIVTTGEVTTEFGECEIMTDSAPITITARTLDNDILHKGDVAVVISHESENNFYFVKKSDSIK